MENGASDIDTQITILTTFHSFPQGCSFHRDICRSSLLLHVCGICAAVLDVGGCAPTLAEGCPLHLVSVVEVTNKTKLCILYVTADKQKEKFIKKTQKHSIVLREKLSFSN